MIRRNACQWIAAIVFRGTSGTVRAALRSAPSVSRLRCPASAARSVTPSAPAARIAIAIDGPGAAA